MSPNISSIGLRLHFLVSPCAAGVAAELWLPIDVEPVAGVRDPAGPVQGGVLGELHDALVPQLAHVHLEQCNVVMNYSNYPNSQDQILSRYSLIIFTYFLKTEYYLNSIQTFFIH